MNSRKAIAAVSIACMAAACILASWMPAAMAADPAVLKISSSLAPSEDIIKGLEAMAAKIHERVGDQLRIEIYTSSQLANNKDSLEMAVRGANVGVTTDPGYLEDYVADYSIMGGPFLFDTYKDLWALNDSDWHQGLKKKASEAGIRVLAMHCYFGFRHLVGKEPYVNPASLQGKKVRVPNNKMWVETINSLGGIATSLELNEAYTGLQQGVADAAESPLSTIYSVGWYEVVPHISKTSHIMSIQGLLISETWFNSLPENVRKVLEEEADAWARNTSKVVADNEAVFEKKLVDAGATIHEADVAAFREACARVYTLFPNWTPGLYEKVRGIIEAAK